MKDRIKKLRLELNFNQEQMGKIFGLTQSAWSSYETGRANMTTEMIIKLYEKHNANPNYLLIGRGQMFIEKHESESHFPKVSEAPGKYETGDKYLREIEEAARQLSQKQRRKILKIMFLEAEDLNESIA